MKLLGQSLPRPAALVQDTDGESVSFSEFCHVMLGTFSTRSIQHPIGMKLIFGMSYILKIFKAIIAPVPIFVIDFIVKREWSNKGSHYKPMNLMVFLSALLVQDYSAISLASFLGKRFQLTYSAVAPLAYTLYLAAITYFINSFVTNNCFPIFHGRSVTYLG